VEAVRRLFAILLLVFAGAAIGADVPGDVVAQGKPDGAIPGWTIHAPAPAGWTADCCTYARAIGVDAVIYRGEWTGEPYGVMVLNVWPRKLASLDAELEADRKRYLQRDPAARVGRFPVRHHGMPCGALVFRGSDQVDDVVVFCEPAKASGIRLSWSMSFKDGDAHRAALLDAFMRTAVGTRYRAAASR